MTNDSTMRNGSKMFIRFAYHEAAHAVVAYRSGIPLGQSGVDVREDGGQTATVPLSEIYDLEKIAIYALSGAVAESRIANLQDGGGGPSPTDLGAFRETFIQLCSLKDPAPAVSEAITLFAVYLCAGIDVEETRRDCLAQFGIDAAFETWLPALFNLMGKTYTVVHNNWGIINALAERLMCLKKMSGPDVEEFLANTIRESSRL